MILIRSQSGIIATSPNGSYEVENVTPSRKADEFGLAGNNSLSNGIF